MFSEKCSFIMRPKGCHANILRWEITQIYSNHRGEPLTSSNTINLFNNPIKAIKLIIVIRMPVHLLVEFSFLSRIVESRLAFRSLVPQQCFIFLLNAISLQMLLNTINFRGWGAWENPAAEVLLDFAVFKMFFIRFRGLLLVGRWLHLLCREHARSVVVCL